MNDVLSFAAHRLPQTQTFLICSLIDEVCASLGPQFDAQGVDLDLDVPPNTTLTADREMVRTAVLHLVLNALNSMPQGGCLVITTYSGTRSFEIEVADSGPGLSEELSRRLSKPAHPVHESDNEAGLAVVHQVAAAHGGTVTAENCPEGGAAFTIRFPHERAMQAAA